MDDGFLITTTADQAGVYTPPLELEAGDNAVFADFQVLRVTGDVTLSYWVEESIDGACWEPRDRVDGADLVVVGDSGGLMSSVLGGIVVRFGVAITDQSGTGGSILLHVAMNPARR